MKHALAIIFGLAYLALGAAMLIDPHGWYSATPGVPTTGPFNPHFVTDIGLAFVASGALWLGAAFVRPQRGGLALGASLWPALHAGFHLVEWAAHGVPSGAAFWAEGVGVIAVAALSLGLAIVFFRERTV